MFYLTLDLGGKSPGAKTALQGPTFGPIDSMLVFGEKLTLYDTSETQMGELTFRDGWVYYDKIYYRQFEIHHDHPVRDRVNYEKAGNQDRTPEGA